MLRVLIDATAVPADRRGVGRYVDNLVPALVKAGVDVRVACKPDDVEHYSELSASDAVSGGPATRHPAARLMWEQTAFPALAAQVAPDLLHSPHYTHPLLSRLPSVVTLHDATFFSDPGVHTRVKGPFFRAATRAALRHASRCIVDSQASLDELVRFTGADRDRLQVAHLGVDTALFSPPTPDQVQAVRARLGLAPDEAYLAFLGTREPRKNIPELLRGWVRSCADRADPPALVLAGGAGWDDQLDAAIAAVPTGLRLIQAGYLPLDELPAFLGGATVVAYPSLGEGFGLPVLEAMACGAPVLTTRRLALPEVGGDAVAYTEPDAPAIASALSALLDDPQRRAELSAAGVVRASGFTWDACAAATIDAYERALRTRGPRPAVGAAVEPPADARVGVVVVTYSPGPALNQFLDSLATATTRPVDVVLADNGSTDGSVEAAATRPGVRLLRTGGNVGYGRAVNAALIDCDEPFVVIANPDVVWLPGALDELLSAAGRWPDAGSLGPLIRTPAGEIYPSARALPSLGRGIGHALCGWWWPSNPWTAAYRHERGDPVEGPTGWLSGSCLLVRREAFDAVGGFDPSYFMYFEDLDFGDRLGRAGWRNVYVPTATVVHTGGHATSRQPSRMAAEHHRSAWIYLSRRYAGWRWAPVRVLLRMGLAARSVLASRLPSVAEGAAPARRQGKPQRVKE